MRKAAAQGIIDFKDAKLLDRKWWRRLNWLLEEIEIKECKELVNLKFIQHSSALNYLSGKQAFDLHWKQLQELTNQWIQLGLPWTEKTSTKTTEDLFEMWKRAYPDTEDRNKKIQAFADEVKAKTGTK